MRKELALLLTIMLLCYCFTPFVSAEETAAPKTPSTTTAPKPSTKPAAKPAAKPTATPTVTVDTYLADQLSDLKSLSKDDKKKINVLLKMDAIEKSSADTFGVEDAINRAQLAKTATLVLGLTIENMVTGSSFTDVSTNDVSSHYVEALKKANLTYDAVDSKFNPTGNVTRQELAMLLIKGLGLDEKAKAAAPSKDETVDANYKSYVTYALQQKLMTNQADGKFGGTVTVTRKTLALASYAALQLHLTTAKPAKASIAEVKVIGKTKMIVRLNRDVDANKAVLTVTKDGLLDSDGEPLPLTGGVDWSEDNTTATMNMDDKFVFGSYQVVLSDVDVAKGTMTFMPETERVTKVEFVTNTEKLPKSKVLIEYKATNQFGEKMELSASNVNVIVSASATKNVVPTIYSSINAIGMDLSNVLYNSSITVVILEKSGYISVSKTFPVGDPPQVKKIDLGDAKNNIKLPSGQLLFRSGEKAYLAFKAYDQYENRVVDPLYLNIGIQRMFTGGLGNVFKSEGQNDFVDFENDGYPDLQLVAYPGLNSDKEVTITLFYDGKQVSQTVLVRTPKSPSAITIGPLAKPMTEGDTNVSINLKIVDSSNYELTPAERASLLSSGKISLFATGGITLGNPAIDANGAIIVQQVTGPGPATINIRQNGTNQVVTLQTNIETGRKPDKIIVDANGSAANVLALNGLANGVTTAKAQFIIYDQFGIEYKTKRDDYKVQLKLEKISGDTGSVVSVTYGSKKEVWLSDANLVALKDLGDVDITSLTFNPSPTLSGSYKLTATIVHVEATTGQILEALSSDSVTVDVKNIANANLTYSVEMSASGDLFAIGRALLDTGAAPTVTDITYLLADYSMLTQTAVVKVKDGSSVEAFSITPKAVTSDNPKVIGTRGNRVIGLDTGRTNLTVWYDSPLGGLQKLTITKGSNVDILVPTEIKTNGGPATFTGDPAAILNGKYIWDSSLMGKLQATTGYGTINLHQATYLLGVTGVQAFISDIEYTTLDTSKQDQIVVNPDFTLTYTKKGGTRTIKQFAIYVVAGTYSKSFVVKLE
ncbi:hypothetical protein GQF01_13600 [Paenibacillus sp. 5J-6]|uniref:SLH domain-containing protein n=1 Tax=Paenibacillus silvestris TaxID=2606219 RepID=A0A6L8UYY7_9BACL|nr:S-layer homology domain-containing protein [Paenibacillus silvestris]MZQ83144.1 hypothetical protein [Paenibacillus silvestris]